ncbi:hypothetical protein LSUE1_G003838, partial [Lachnellula suecica]
MSKITPKSLSYDATLPPFLARLQSSNNGPSTFQAARPSKPRTAEDEAEDEPVYFNEESGETLTKKEWEDKDKAEVEEEVEKGEGGKVEEGKVEEGKVEEKVAGIGG